MIITCPRCSTRYVIDPAVLVPNGRAVGCSNCGHHWTQTLPAPEDAAPPAEAVPESLSEAPPDAEADVEIQSVVEADQEIERQPPAMEESAAGTPDAAALEPAGAPAAFAETDHQTSDPEPPGPEKEEEPEARADMPADTEKAPPVVAEPEPIPAALREGKSPAERGRQNQKKKPSVAMLAGLGALAALIVIAVVLVVARGPIVSAIPGTAGLYRGVGLLGDELGAGLEIRDVRSARQRDGANEVLTIEGIVANVTDRPLDLPMVRVSLSDADGEELQFVTVPPELPALPPGETVSFEARISNPSAVVRRVKVKFAPPDGSPSDH